MAFLLCKNLQYLVKTIFLSSHFKIDKPIPKGYHLLNEHLNILGEYTKMVNYTAKYTKISSGYMGQLVEWPEVVTEGKDLENCREMLRDALHEMLISYQELGKEIPLGNALIEQLPIEVQSVSQAS